MRILLPSVLVLSLSGCVPVDPDELGDPENVTVSFAIKGPGGAPAACPPGFDTLMFEATEFIGLIGFRQFIPCEAAGSHVFSLFTRGVEHVELEDGGEYYIKAHENYEIQLSVTDATGTVVRVSSFAHKLDLSSGPKSVEMDIYPDAGFLAVGWQFDSTLTESRITSCAAANVDSVQLRYQRYTDDRTEPIVVQEWPCENELEGFYKSDEAEGNGLTPALAPDTYVGRLHAFRGGVELAMSDDDLYFDITANNGLYEREGSVKIPDR
jgi:hypothetical protein